MSEIERIALLWATHRCEIMSKGSNPGHFWHFGQNLKLWNFIFAPQAARTVGIVHAFKSVGGQQARNRSHPVSTGRERNMRLLHIKTKPNGGVREFRSL